MAPECPYCAAESSLTIPETRWSAIRSQYLDSFPFPYYVVLRDIGALPATLADLLRQWFQLQAAP